MGVPPSPGGWAPPPRRCPFRVAPVNLFEIKFFDQEFSRLPIQIILAFVAVDPLSVFPNDAPALVEDDDLIVSFGECEFCSSNHSLLVHFHFSYAPTIALFGPLE